MKVKILFDKNARDKKLHTGWGVSFLINDEILFDTGENGGWLMENLEMLHADAGRIKAAVISHDHWDHTGGLWELLKKRKDLIIYACSRSSAEFKKKVNDSHARLIETANVAEIAEDIFVTGEIAGEYKGEYMPEQALAVRTERGLTVITGCSHPGIVAMLENVKNNFGNEKIYLVFGGFHLMDTDRKIIESIVEKFKNMNVANAGPTHCSGPEAEKLFKKEYGDNFIRILAGETIEI